MAARQQSINPPYSRVTRRVAHSKPGLSGPPAIYGSHCWTGLLTCALGPLLPVAQVFLLVFVELRLAWAPQSVSLAISEHARTA